MNSIKRKDYTVDKSITSIKKKDDIVDRVEEQRAKSVCNRPNEITLLDKITKTAEVSIDQDNL